MLPAEALVRPDWPWPPGVAALMSTRLGGVSTAAPLASLNLGRRVGDDEQALAENRRRFESTLQARAVWLQQVHGTQVLALTHEAAGQPPPPADAAWTAQRGLACVVGAADCMPVLLAARDGRAVAAAHAGWRGLADGVIEATVRALCEGVALEPSQLQAWLGPCIGPRHFEVGADVLQAFGLPVAERDAPHFRFTPRPDGQPRWHADLRGLGRERLVALGLRSISVDPACTFADSSRFFSFRRDRAGGRMAAAIWRV